MKWHVNGDLKNISNISRNLLDLNVDLGLVWFHLAQFYSRWVKGQITVNVLYYVVCFLRLIEPKLEPVKRKL